MWVLVGRLARWSRGQVLLCLLYDSLSCFLDILIYRNVLPLVTIFTYLRIHLCTLIWQKWNWKRGTETYNICVSHILMSIYVTCSIQKSQCMLLALFQVNKQTWYILHVFEIKTYTYVQNLKRLKKELHNIDI